MPLLGHVLQICWEADLCFGPAFTLDMCYRSVELTQTPWPDAHNCCKRRPTLTSLTSTAAVPSILSSKRYSFGGRLSPVQVINLVALCLSSVSRCLGTVFPVSNMKNACWKEEGASMDWTAKWCKVVRHQPDGCTLGTRQLSNKLSSWRTPMNTFSAWHHALVASAHWPSTSVFRCLGFCRGCPTLSSLPICLTWEHWREGEGRG